MEEEQRGGGRNLGLIFRTSKVWEGGKMEEREQFL